MRLVNDDRERAAPMLVADLVQDDGKFLNRGDNDLLARLDKLPKLPGALGNRAHCRAYLRELPDGVADLLVQQAPVSDDDDRVERRPAVFIQADQLVLSLIHI